MSGFIHITHKTPAWQHALRLLCVVGVLLALVWYGLSDEGLPIAPPGGAAATPFVKATPLQAPPRLHPPQDTSADHDAHADTAARASAESPQDDDDDDDDDYAARNAGIDIHRLTLQRPMAARTFLSEVLLAPGSQAGFVVAEVLPESRYERMGLQPGDVIYTLDTPGTPSIDESSMVALMQQTDIELEVYRKGTLTRLHVNLAKMENGDELPR